MTEQKRKKLKPYFDDPKPKRTCSEGSPAMSTPTTPPIPVSVVTQSVEKSTEPMSVAPAEVPVPAPSDEPLAASANTPVPSSTTPAGDEPAGATKGEPETLEQFIEYAYGRKGQRLSLKPKVEKQIAQSSRLEDAVLSRLLQLAKEDALLAVPRQILLRSQEVTGFPGLRSAMISFVSNVMLRHPVFGDAVVQGALRNLPEGLPPADALAKVAAFEPLREGDAEPLKGADLQELQHNAVRLFVTWLAVNRSLNSDELSSLLFQVIWQPAAQNLPDDNARLRALTDVRQAEGVGLACQRFRQQAIAARAQQDRSQREATDLREKLAAAEAKLTATRAQLEAVQGELRALQERSTAELDGLRRQHAVAMTHLQHELEQLRGRLVKRLTDSVDMLEVGLSALRKESPRVPVMLERAEHVVDALRDEIQELRED